MIDVLETIERAIGRINLVLLKLLSWLAIALIGAMFVIVVAAVFWRYVLNDALAWSEEVSKFLMVWMTFVAAPIAFHRGALVGIEMVINSVKGRLHQLLQLLIAVSVLGLMYVFVTEGWFLTQNAGIQRAFTVNVSIYWVYIVMPVGSALMALVAVELLIAALKGLLDPSRARPRAAADRPLSE